MKAAKWYPVAFGLSVINLVAVVATAGGGAWHAAIHAALALACGLWAQRLRLLRRGGELHAGVEALELEVNELREELGELQERLDFAERVLTREEARRLESEEEDRR